MVGIVLCEQFKVTAQTITYTWRVFMKKARVRTFFGTTPNKKLCARARTSNVDRALIQATWERKNPSLLKTHCFPNSME